MEKKYTIKEIKRYLNKQDSMGDIYYNLNEENMDAAQEIIKIYDSTEELILTIDLDFVDENTIKSIIIDWLEEEKQITNLENNDLYDLLDEFELRIEGDFE